MTASDPTGAEVDVVHFTDDRKFQAYDCRLV
jgi:hypothetical protein